MRVKATYDGEVLRLSEPLDLPPGTEVWITIDGPPPERIGKPKSFIDTALSLNGEGPSDWSQRVDHYLYGDLVDDDDEG